MQILEILREVVADSRFHHCDTVKDRFENKRALAGSINSVIDRRGTPVRHVGDYSLISIISAEPES
jgi:hypothetical protein